MWVAGDTKQIALLLASKFGLVSIASLFYDTVIKNLVKHPMNSGECRNQICFLELLVLL